MKTLIVEDDFASRQIEKTALGDGAKGARILMVTGRADENNVVEAVRWNPRVLQRFRCHDVGGEGPREARRAHRGPLS